jgi:hypothetical protein
LQRSPSLYYCTTTATAIIIFATVLWYHNLHCYRRAPPLPTVTITRHQVSSLHSSPPFLVTAPSFHPPSIHILPSFLFSFLPSFIPSFFRSFVRCFPSVISAHRRHLVVRGVTEIIVELSIPNTMSKQDEMSVLFVGEGGGGRKEKNVGVVKMRWDGEGDKRGSIPWFSPHPSPA